MTESGKALDEINERIAILRCELVQAGKLGLQSLNKYCENLVLQLLNIAFDLNLINLNQQTHNYPGLDLGDEGNRIAFQVTATKTSEKVNDTLQKCLDHQNYKTFTSINIFILIEKQQSYTINTVTLPQFNFDHSKNVQDFGDFLRAVANLPLEKIRTILGIVNSELPGVLVQLRKRSLMWNIPQLRNSYFSGREATFENIRRNLVSSKVSGLIQAISGLGGIGKTQVAIEYAYRFRSDYNACFWVVADSETTLVSGFVELAKMLELEEAEFPDQTVIVKAVMSWLDTYDNWLLILDNADTPSFLKSFIPKNPKGHLIVTSRSRILDMLGISKPILLAEMNPSEALGFILKRTDRENEREDSIRFALELVHELGYLPLAIEQAGAFMLTHQTRFEDYLSGFKSNKLLLLGRSSPVTGEYAQTVATTWSMNFYEIEQNNSGSADLLRLSAFFGPDRIPLELIQKGYFGLDKEEADSKADLEDDPIAMDIILEPLTRYSLIRRSTSSNSYDIHRLVQEVIKEDMPEQHREEWSLKAVRSINAIFPSGSYSTWATCERLLSHAVLCAEWIEKYKFTYLDAGELLNGVACYLRMRARYVESEKIHLQSLRIRQRDLGPTDPEVATALNNLACVYFDLYSFEKAEPLFSRALQINESVLGPDNHELSLNCNNLGMLYVRWCNYAKAKPLLDRAFELEKKAPQSEEFFLALILNNLAEYYVGTQDYATAEPLARQSLDIREKIGNHEKTVRSYVTMATILYKKGNMTAAETFFKKALVIKEELYGREHPELIQLLINYLPFLASNNKTEEWRLMNEQLQTILSKYAIEL